MKNGTTDRRQAQHNNDNHDTGLIYLGHSDSREPDDTGWWASTNPAEGTKGPTVSIEGRFIGDGEHREHRAVTRYDFTLPAWQVVCLLWATETPEGREKLEALVAAAAQEQDA